MERKLHTFPLYIVLDHCKWEPTGNWDRVSIVVYESFALYLGAVRGGAVRGGAVRGGVLCGGPRDPPTWTLTC